MTNPTSPELCGQRLSTLTIEYGCVVPLPGGTTCGWARDGKHSVCAAHRMRMRLHGDYRAHVPVLRKPSRRPEEVAVRRARPVWSPTNRVGAVVFL